MHVHGEYFVVVVNEAKAPLGDGDDDGSKLLTECVHQRYIAHLRRAVSTTFLVKTVSVFSGEGDTN